MATTRINNNAENNQVIAYRNSENSIGIVTYDSQSDSDSREIREIITLNYDKEIIENEKIKSKIDKIKDLIDINKDLEIQDFIAQSLSNLSPMYRSHMKNNNNDDLINSFILQFMNDEFIDENFVDNFKDEEMKKKIENSIMYKKNIKKNDISFTVDYLNPFYFCKSKKRKIYCLSQKYQNDGIKFLSLMYMVIFLLFLIIGVIMSMKTFFVKSDSFFQRVSNNTKGGEYFEFYSNEYRCLPLDLDNLLNEDFSINLSCTEEKQFFYISKFGISNLNEEGENIAGCYSKSFKNLINIDSNCDLSDYLNNQLNVSRFKEGEIIINMGRMNIPNRIINNCRNCNRTTKFYLSYSCYIPFFKKDSKTIKRNKFILPVIYLEVGSIIFIYFLSICYRLSFSAFLQQKELNIKNLSLMIDDVDFPKEKMPFVLNYIIKSLNLLLKQKTFLFLQEINYSFINNEEKELYNNLNFAFKKLIFLQNKIDSGKKNDFIERNILIGILSKIFVSLKKTYQEEYDETKKKIKRIIVTSFKKERYQ